MKKFPDPPLSHHIRLTRQPAEDSWANFFMEGITLLAFDLTAGNRKCIMDGKMTAVISQHPEMQGFSAVKSIIRYLLYKQCDKKISHRMPIDIVVAENLPYCRNYLAEL